MSTTDPGPDRAPGIGPHDSRHAADDPQEVAHLIRAADPLPDRPLRSSATATTLREAIMTSTHPRSLPRPAIPARFRSRALLAAAATGIAVAATVGVGVVLAGGGVVGEQPGLDAGAGLADPASAGDSPPGVPVERPATGPDPSQPVDGAPPLVIDRAEWSMDMFLDGGGDGGTAVFTDGSTEVELNWEAADRYESRVAQYAPADDGASESTVDVPGGPALLFSVRWVEPPVATSTVDSLEAPPDASESADSEVGATRATAVWRAFGWTLYLDSTDLSTTDFTTLAGDLVAVDDEAWRAALPVDVLTDDAAIRSAAAAALGTTPLPERTDLDDLGTFQPATEPDIRTSVAAAVACAWLGEWAAEDDEGREAVASRLASWQDWDVFAGTAADAGTVGQGDYGMGAFVDAVLGDGLVTGPDGGQVAVADAYAERFCD